MTELSKMVSGSIDWPVNGKVYKLSPIKIREMGLFTMWVEGEYKKDITEIAEQLKEGSAEFLIKALKEKPTGAELAKKVSDAMVSIEGTKELVYISLKKNHSDITREIVNNLITFENITVVQDLLDSISGFENEYKIENNKSDLTDDSKKKQQIGDSSSVSSQRPTDGHRSK